MKNVPLLLGTLLVTIVLIVGVSMLFSRQVEQDAQPVDNALLMDHAKMVQGPENAKVTVVEFSDLQCPACRSVDPTVKQILTEHPNDVRFVYRQFPIVSAHQNAQQAALTAVAIHQISPEKFWQFHDWAFENQDTWGSQDAETVKKTFESEVLKLDIDKTQFQQRIDSQEVRDQVSQDVSDATALGVDGTPTFYVNGRKTAAPQLVQVVESFLQQ